MNREALIDKLANRMYGDHGFARSVVKELIVIMQEGLAADGVVKIGGLGTIIAKWQPEREYAVPTVKGKKVVKPGYFKIVFKPAKALKEAVAVKSQ